MQTWSVVEKHRFHQHKSLVLIGDVSINKVIVSSKAPLDKKDFKDDTKN